jgi:hypothetical protein
VLATLTYADEDSSTHARRPPAERCGSYRWPVKILSDPGAHAVDHTATETSVETLANMPAPVDPTARVAPVETHVWQLTGVHAVGLREEPDSDIHLVVSDQRGHTMITEFPSPGCDTAASAPDRTGMSRARADLVPAFGEPGRAFRRVTGTVTLRGVGFFDRLHGQRGVAANGVELHPVVGFRAAAARAA